MNSTRSLEIVGKQQLVRTGLRKVGKSSLKEAEVWRERRVRVRGIGKNQIWRKAGRLRTFLQTCDCRDGKPVV